jgi:hypothetical protein
MKNLCHLFKMMATTQIAIKIVKKEVRFVVQFPQNEYLGTYKVVK